MKYFHKNPGHDSFLYQGYGRIYVEFTKEILKVEAIIQSMDEFEFDYYPSGLVTEITNYPQVIDIGKFDIDLDELYAKCKAVKLNIFTFDAEDNPYPMGFTKTLTQDEILTLIKS